MRLLEFFPSGHRWAYHTTPIANIPSISRRGLVPGYTPGAIFLSAEPGDYAPTRGLCLLRFPWPADATPLWISEIDPLEYVTRTVPIPPQSIEVMDASGRFVALSDGTSVPLKQDGSGLARSRLVPVPPPGSLSKDDL